MDGKKVKEYAKNFLKFVAKSLGGIKKQDAPNLLTFARIAVIPLILILMYIPTAFTAWAALFFYIAAAVTDWFDGYLARRWKTTSDIGKFLDPIADKLLVTAIILMLAVIGRLNGIWFIPALVIVSREIFVSGLREFLGPKNITVPVSRMAKVKTGFQMTSLGFLIMAEDAPEIFHAEFIGLILLTVSAVLTGITGWHYLEAALPVFAGDKAKGKKTEIIDVEPMK